jgi:hydroxymethylbilane synthase
MTNPPLRIGTRGSPLALAQAEEVHRRLVSARPELGAAGALAVAAIRTTGDRVFDRPLSEIGGKGLFTKEIDEALLDGRIDLAVHSMKDLPTRLADGLVIGAILPREDPRDAWISRHPGGLDGLPAGAVVGTASLRRAAQVLHRRPDVTVVPLRGNVGTRLEKVARGEVDATLLALAGLRRLGLAEAATAVLDPEDMLPAVAQGAIGIACRAGDDEVGALVAALDDAETALTVTAERAMLARLDGSCRTPIAALAVGDGAGGALDLRGLIAKTDGSAVVESRQTAPAADAAALGEAVAESLLRQAGPGFLAGR